MTPAPARRARARAGPPAAVLLVAGLLALGVAVGEGRGAAAPSPGDGGAPSSLDIGEDRPERAGVGWAVVDRAYLQGPPAGHTGGFDEPTCRACHFDRPLNPEGGDVRLDGVPDRWVADSVYDVRVVLTHDEMERAGFQLAVRWREGRREGCSAGRLEPAGVGTQSVAASDSADGGCDVVYVQHTEEGTGPVGGGEARWRVRWRAPGEEEARGPVVFHVAANAANDDASEFGDWIYAAEARSRPRE